MPVSSTPGEGSAGLNIFQLGHLEGSAEGSEYNWNARLDSLSKSEQEKLILNLLADNPMLIFGQSNLFSANFANLATPEAFAAALMAIESRRNEIISGMLDAWVDSVAEQKKLSEQAYKKQEITEQQTESDQRKRDVINDYIVWADSQPSDARPNVADAAVFSDYLRFLTQQQRYEAVTSTLNELVDNYFEKVTPPAVEDSDIARGALSAFILNAMVIAPASQNVVLQPINMRELSTQIAVNPVSDQVNFEAGQFPQRLAEQVLPAINFFVLDMVKDVTITLYLKQQETGKNPVDKDFANSFADRVLSEVSRPDVIKEKLIRQIPGFENATAEQLADAVTYAQLFSLASALGVFVKAEGGANLQENELKEMLLEGKGIPEGDKRADIVAMMNAIIFGSDTIPGIPVEKREQFVEALLRYVSSMPDPDQLTDFMTALNAASAEVSMGERAVHTRRD
ncbi:hypothetical protein [Estrella lausannensis]|uniref:Uncharacterized protein n=1 Tax=Estrella lausannensis TaxID=483423 RepID=A0A0H5DR43_9BACT|nr:hypothetical protein [Estrella lausannensis]CRX39057.1 Conserved hypothetical protein [Estrella lausannensis]